MKVLSILVFGLFLVGCTFTSTKTYEPKFKHNFEIIKDKIGSHIAFDQITIAGTKNTVDGKTERIIEILILNASNLPKNDDSLEELSKVIAKEIKEHLVNRGEFDIYRINFTSLNTEEAVKSSSSKDLFFKDEDL